MARKRKRQRARQKRRHGDLIDIIRKFLPDEQSLLSLPDFLKTYAPSLELSLPSEHDELSDIVLGPTATTKAVPHLKKPSCQEPVHSIIEDVLSILLQRKSRLKRTGQVGSNVLLEGSSGYGSSANWRSNDNIHYCKTSRLVQKLHVLLGDEILRMIFLHTRLLVPATSDDDTPKHAISYLLLCGPPLPKGKVTLPSKSTNSVQKQVSRKRKRDVKPSDDVKLKPNSVISRFSLFYCDSYSPVIGLTKMHPLNKPESTPENILAMMVDLYDPNGKKRRKRWKRLQEKGLEVCSKVLSGVRKCDFHRTLERYCPLPDCAAKRDYTNDTAEHDDPVALQDLGKAFTPCESVASYIVSVLKSVFPAEFWGSRHNLDAVIGTVREFISLRRTETFSNKRLVHGIRTVDLGWLHGNCPSQNKLSRTSHEATVELLLLVFRWLFKDFIIPLLRNGFYITETEFTGKRVCYFRKPVWSKFRALSMKKLTDKQFRELTPSEVNQCLLAQKMGFSRLRLLPKKTGVRPIAHLSKALQIQPVQQPANQRIKGSSHDEARSAKKPRLEAGRSHSIGALSTRTLPAPFQRSTNSILSEVFDVLTYECKVNEGSFGAGLTGLAEFYPRYHRYLVELKKTTENTTSLGLVFASVDIEKCYDTINQSVMYDIAERQMTSEDYLIRQCSMTYANTRKGILSKMYKKSATPPEKMTLLRGNNAGLTKARPKTVFESRRQRLTNRRKLCEVLKEHLSSHLVATSGRYGNRYLIQTAGISQGSVLSMLLCNLYYAEIENILLHRDNPQAPQDADLTPGRPHYFMARLVDDFLCICTRKDDISRFLQKMHRGKVELGVQINRDKTRVSERIDEDANIVNPDAPIPHGAARMVMFPWCGLLFDTNTGEVRVDYSRFHGGRIRDGLTVDVNGNEGTKLAAHMQHFIRPRCLPILFDTSINSERIIMINFYQMMLFAAAKSTEYFRSFGVINAVASNQHFIVQCINSLTSYSYWQIRRNFDSHGKTCHIFRLDKALISSVTWHAFLSVFGLVDDMKELARFLWTRFRLDYQHAERHFSKTLQEALDKFEIEKLLGTS